MAVPDPPADYPVDLEGDAVLADGRRVHIRPVVPGDREQLRERIRTADEETLRLRFAGGDPPIAEAELDRLVHLDYRSRLALAAFDDQGRGVGIARYESHPGGTEAEVAVAVDPEWRRVGLATELLIRLAAAAEAQGITAFTALVAGSNRPIEAFLERIGLLHSIEWHDGQGEIRIHLIDW